MKKFIKCINHHNHESQKTADTCVQICLADELHDFMMENGIFINSNEIIFGEMEGYQMLATPSASYGYVYMSFWAV